MRTGAVPVDGGIVNLSMGSQPRRSCRGMAVEVRTAPVNTLNR